MSTHPVQQLGDRLIASNTGPAPVDATAAPGDAPAAAVAAASLGQDARSASPSSGGPSAYVNACAALPRAPLCVAVEVPLRLASVNVRRAWEHWGSRARRVRRERAAVRDALRGHVPSALPVVVRLTRVGWNALDDDNLRPAFKSVRDEVAAWLGCDDRSPLVGWVYEQATTRKTRFARNGMGRGRWEVACMVRIEVRSKESEP